GGAVTACSRRVPAAVSSLRTHRDTRDVGGESVVTVVGLPPRAGVTPPGRRGPAGKWRSQGHARLPTEPSGSPTAVAGTTASLRNEPGRCSESHSIGTTCWLGSSLQRGT